jgi:L-proline amide hydrolase
VAIPEASTTGMLDFRGWHTWYRITDRPQASKTPVVVLHGGPGASHNYTLRMARLAEQGFPVIHYDQIGTGLSTHLPDEGADFWTVELFLDELNTLLLQLGVNEGYHLIGQSWGGMLAAEHAIRRPAGLRSLVIADSPASMDLWVAEANRLRAGLPQEIQAVLRQHEAAGTTDSAEYEEAMKAFYDRHVCRIVPNPPEVTESFDSIAEDPTVYHTMNGPSEFHVIGTLREWSAVDRVLDVVAPTLLVSGAHDEATPATMQPFMDAIPDVRWEIFAESSHMPHVEEEDRFLDVVGDFLHTHE